MFKKMQILLSVFVKKSVYIEIQSTPKNAFLRLLVAMTLQFSAVNVKSAAEISLKCAAKY